MLIAYFLGNTYAKNYENPGMLSQVTAKNVGDIFLRHTVVARSNSCRNVVLRGCGKSRGSISYFLAARSSQMNVEAANNLDSKYYLEPRSIVSVQVRAGDVWVDIVCAYTLFSYGCEVKFVQDSDATMMWEVARCDKVRGAIFYFLTT